MIDTIVSFFKDVANALNSVVSFFTSLFDFMRITFDFIPSPFQEITLIFFPIIVSALLYKIIKR